MPQHRVGSQVSFLQAWQQLQQVSDKLQADQQQVNRAQAEQDASDSLDYPSVDIAGSYTRLAKPIELDLRDLNPLAALDPAALPPALGGAIAAIPGSLFITPFTEQDIFRASLQAMWPIYTGGKITAAQGIKAAQVTEQKQQYTLSQRELFSTLVDRYFAVAVTQKVAATQAELVASLTKHAQHASKLEQQGQIARVELLNAQVALNNAQVQMRHAQRQHEMAQIALSRMLQLPSVAPTSHLFMLPHQPSLVRLNKLTQATHPALKLLQAKEAQANGLVKLEKGSYYPTVFLYGNYTLYEDDSLFAKVEPDWKVGVGVKVPLLSRDGHSGKVQAAKSALLQARHMKAQTKQDLSLLVDQSYRQLLQAEEEINALNSTLALAKENLRLRELAFNQGLSTSVERVDAEIKLNGVKTQQLAAQYRYVQAYAKLMMLSGQLDEFVNRVQHQDLAADSALRITTPLSQTALLQGTSHAGQ
ncbi:TolC family protein [Shewanella intestini]|uniref:TolC family protein n=1 Tax=Shewanella intestini TaxID=2017544 RepID=A0ABS5I4C9_9GAMM|nr:MULTISPECIES: TolC family protein [Shewanella]MBR9728766.1 TolC family protein [Shewanella intestini]MRG36841.1 TolC family protein [Shewanella sp. XMDDZSB0408]